MTIKTNGKNFWIAAQLYAAMTNAFNIPPAYLLPFIRVYRCSSVVAFNCILPKPESSPQLGRLSPEAVRHL